MLQRLYKLQPCRPLKAINVNRQSFAEFLSESSTPPHIKVKKTKMFEAMDLCNCRQSLLSRGIRPDNIQGRGINNQRNNVTSKETTYNYQCTADFE
jgi:hypothetical protein